MIAALEILLAVLVAAASLAVGSCLLLASQADRLRGQIPFHSGPDEN